MQSLKQFTSAVVVAGLGVVAAFLQPPAIAQVSTTGAGPYYATPSWDQKITTGRFVVLTNWNSDAVLDRETGLVWERVLSRETFNAFSAWERCSNLRVGGRFGWRSPKIFELQSLFESSGDRASLPVGHPFIFPLGAEDDFFWATGQLLPGHSDAAKWFATYVSSTPTANAGRTLTFFTNELLRSWCVRGPTGSM